MNASRVSWLVFGVVLFACAQPSAPPPHAPVPRTGQGPEPRPEPEPEPAPAPGPAPAQDPTPSQGQLLLWISDPAADEGMFWDVVVNPDGVFSVEYTWSDGGAASNTARCSGTLPAAEVSRWFTRARDAATLQTPPEHRGERDFSNYEVVLAYESAPERRLYAPLDVHVEDLRAWAKVFIQAC